MNRFIPFIVLIIDSAITASAFTPTSDGIYAVFEVTYWDGDTQQNETGEFTFQFLIGETPVTSATFIGLAEGTLPWWDYEAQQVRGGLDNPEPYFDGLTFHRVVPNFVIQTGSRNGLGTDGPGFRIPDEAYPGRDHVGGGVVSMANSGANTGGSQFFITMAQFPEGEPQLRALNGKHTVFGVIVDGIPLTQAINRTPLIGEKPVNEAIVNKVTIVREGSFANSWDPSQFWVSPVFTAKQLNVTYNLEDLNNDDVPETRVLKGTFVRNPDNIYNLEKSNDLNTWTNAGVYDRQRIVEEQDDNGETIPRVETLFLAADLLDRRHFYRLLEAALPPLPDLDSTRIVIDIDPVADVNPNFVTYQPEKLTVDFFDDLDGAWKLERSDSEAMDIIGITSSYRMFPIGWRSQLQLVNQQFSNMQVYLNYSDAVRNSGTALIYYPDGRREGSLVTGTFTLTEGNARVVPENKDGTGLQISVTTQATGQDPVTTTWDIDLWDNFSEEGLTERFEGGYRITRTNTEFIEQGRVIYTWQIIDGQTYVSFDFESGTDFQTLLVNPTQTTGTAEIYFPSFDGFETGTFTLGAGDPRPDPKPQAGNQLVLTLDLTGQSTDPIQSELTIDFYQEVEGQVPGGYEATRTDSEVNQFGDLLSYEWLENNGETRVTLVYDAIQAMQVYFTFTSGNPSAGGSGTAKVHYPQSGNVGDATFTFNVGGGNARPVRQDKSGTKLTLDYKAEVLDVLTLNILDSEKGHYVTTRQNSTAQPTGSILSYDWFQTRPDGKELIFVDYDRLPDVQILLAPNSTGTAGQAEILSLESGTVTTVPYTIGVADPLPTSINKTGSKLVLDLEITSNNSTIDLLEVSFTDPSTGTWKRNYPPGSPFSPDAGNVNVYEWIKRDGFDQVNLVFDTLRDMQTFLTYDTPTSGTAIIYFVTGAAIVNATFTIQNP